MKKGSGTKAQLSVTVDKLLLKKFTEFCQKNSINKSDKVEKLIKKFMGGKK